MLPWRVRGSVEGNGAGVIKEELMERWRSGTKTSEHSDEFYDVLTQNHTFNSEFSASLFKINDFQTIRD